MSRSTRIQYLRWILPGYVAANRDRRRIDYSILSTLCARLLLPVVLLLGMGAFSVRAFTLLSSNQLVFVNVDHAPMGACSTMAYGYHGQPCGIGTSSGVYPYWDSW